ncbi:hypothetical protein ANCCEY_02412 [Ancylostoma ceylanicum]|uniref:Uncharacterized protein n=1 Tax=Ancylostoma ceylanicum TaxID=53326 RepID=A0A0D6MC81_9BILA|nr:hypothetical protein ANCCEY_02412 [Ancylostoma ceylanicum]
MAEKEVHYEAVESPIVEHHEAAVEQSGGGDHQIPSEPEETTRVSEVDVVIEPATATMNHVEHASEEEAAVETMTKDIIVADPNAEAEEQLISPVPKSSDVDSVPVAEIASPAAPPAPKAHEGGASLADELAGVFGGPSPAPLAELPVEEMHAAPAVEHPAKEAAAEPVKEVLTEHPPVEKPVEKPSEVPPVEKLVESPQPAEALLIDLGVTPREEKVPEKAQVEVTEHPSVEKVPENPPVEKPTESSPAEEKPKTEKVSYENPLIDFHTNEDERVKTTTNVVTTEHVHTERVTNHVHTNGIEQQAPPVITADLPGTVPAKEIDESVTRKVPTPPNEFIAHRLRREQEQREIDERKARIAAILAKSRDLSSGTPIVAGRTSPPRGETAQDVLKRLASNGNLPALQKLVARRTPEPPTIDQLTF